MVLKEDCLRVRKMAIPYFFLLLAFVAFRICTVWVVMGTTGLRLLATATTPTVCASLATVPQRAVAATTTASDSLFVLFKMFMLNTKTKRKSSYL